MDTFRLFLASVACVLGLILFYYTIVFSHQYGRLPYGRGELINWIFGLG